MLQALCHCYLRAMSEMDEPVPDLVAVANDDDVPDLEPVAGPSRSPPGSYDRRKVPLTLLTGYLGAGKSTLLEYILTADHGYRIAVCMNDFGDSTDIEEKALTLNDPATQARTESFLSLPNGCLCCSVKDMGIAAIEEMVQGIQGGVDWVLVELTGLADPGPIARRFWSNEEMGDLVLDGIVCVVDCKNVLPQLAHAAEGESECQRQIACADMILLNKTDIADADLVEEVEGVVRLLNPTLRIRRTVKSRIDLRELFDLHAFSDTHRPPVGNDDHEDDHEDEEDQEHEHDHPAPGRHGSISTVLVPFPPLSSEQYDRLNAFLESLLWNHRLPSGSDPPDILRSKGFIPLLDGRQYVLQGVTDLFELKEYTASSPTPEARGKVVLIGRGVTDDLKDEMLQYINA